jgi:CRP-like cAMP-binding protein
VPGHAVRLSVPDFRVLVETLPAFRGVLNRYAQGLFVQIAQSVACNRAHSVDERCARWSLITHDRVEGDTFPLTREFLAQMLGVRRPTVSTAQSMLQKAWMIRYSRGNVTVVDWAKLEEAICECHRIVRRNFERLIGAPVG